MQVVEVTIKESSKLSSLRPLYLAALAATILACFACEDLEVADYNSEFRPVPTIERAPTVLAAPTAEVAPTIAKFEGFETAPTAEKFEGYEQAPTQTTFEGFEQAPTAQKFEGFSEGNPCETFLENPTPKNAKNAAEWAMEQLDGAGGEINPEDHTRVAAACEAALDKGP